MQLNENQDRWMPDNMILMQKNQPLWDEHLRKNYFSKRELFHFLRKHHQFSKYHVVQV